MEDLIRNVQTLFDERPSQPSPVTSNVAEATSTHTYGLSPGFPQSSETQSTGSTSRHRPGLVDGTHTSTQSSFSTFPCSDGAAVNRFTPLQAALMSPLRGLSLSRMPTEAVQTATQEQPTKTRDTKGKSRRFPHFRLPHFEAPRILQSPPEIIASSTSDFVHSSATSLQTTMRPP